MMGLFSRLFKSSTHSDSPLKWDMHNHILPALDDGSVSPEQSLQMARMYVELGYNKLIATPHIMSDYYPNNRKTISSKMKLMNQILLQNNIPLEIDFAAEYYMDEVFAEQIHTKGDILTFHGKHVLVETSFMNKPMFFSKIMFDLISSGYLPVLAHPERYVYFHDHYEEAEHVINSGVKFQINLLSLESYYSPAVKKFAAWLIQNGYYHFLGTDAHRPEHLEILKKVFSSSLFSKIDFSKVENASN